MRNLVLLFSLWNLFSLSFAHQALAKKSAKAQITYRKMSASQTYKGDAATGDHLNIKVTPPKNMGANEFIFVEIFNKSAKTLSVVRFDITLVNQQGVDLSTEIQGDDILPGRSAVRKIATPGKGSFPAIKKLSIEGLKIIDDKSQSFAMDTYVDLVSP